MVHYVIELVDTGFSRRPRTDTDRQTDRQTRPNALSAAYAAERKFSSGQAFADGQSHLTWKAYALAGEALHLM